MKSALSMALVAVLTVSLFAGCAKPATTAGASNGKKIKVGVVQLVEHEALDASYKGFIDGMAKAGYIQGDNMTVDYQNAQGEQANCVTIASKLVNDKNDLILAIATPAAQAVASTTKDIPIIITAVTDPADAKLVNTNELPGTNVTGTSDLTPCAEQIGLIPQLFPEAKTVGMLYSSSESNSVFQVNLAKAAAEKLGLKTIDYTVSSLTEIESVVQSMVGKVDVIYSPTDNMIASGMATVSMIATQNKLPIVVAEKGMLDNGGLATYAISYYNLGLLTAEQAVKVLDGAKPAELPIAYLTDFELSINEKAATELGIVIPDEIKAKMNKN